jgi:glutamine synthetase
MAEPLTLVETFFRAHPGINRIRLIVVDYGNIVRVRHVTKSRFLDIARLYPTDSQQITSPSPVVCAFLKNEQILWDMLRHGSDYWKPDWSTLRPFPAEAGYAIVMCDVEMGTEEVKDKYARCPRSVLRSIEAQAKEKGIDLLVGHEIEFKLISSDPPKAYAGGGLFNSAANRSPEFKVIEKTIDCLEEAGYGVWGYHTEYGVGQWEVPLSPLSPLAAADAVTFANETIKTVAYQHGFHATMYPIPPNQNVVNGSHVHISVSQPERDGDGFLAGMLKHARALSAVLQGDDGPVAARSQMIGRNDVVWGPSKASPIVRVSPGRFEVRWPDSLSSPFVQLAAIIAAGYTGATQQYALSMKPSYGNKQGLAPLTDEQKAEMGVTDRIPDTFAERIQCLEDDRAVFDRLLGPKFVQSFIDYRREELAIIAKVGADAYRDISIVSI